MKCGRALRLRKSGQVLVLATVLVFLFILVAAVLIDVYQIEEARNWGYRVASQAAATGASLGRDWGSFQPTPDPLNLPTPPSPGDCIEPGRIRLNQNDAENNALAAVTREMTYRGITGYSIQIRVLPNPDGGSVPGWPPERVRLGAARGFFSSDVPAVGVYLTFPVHTFFMSIVGRSTVTVNVFGAAEVAQPPRCPTPTP